VGLERWETVVVFVVVVVVGGCGLVLVEIVYGLLDYRCGAGVGKVLCGWILVTTTTRRSSTTRSTTTDAAVRMDVIYTTTIGCSTTTTLTPLLLLGTPFPCISHLGGGEESCITGFGGVAFFWFFVVFVL